MNGGPLVSVIIPTYNRAGIISQTVDNIFQQTYRNFELIIVDDGSTDDTQSKLRQYGNRIRVVKQTNAGPAVARNHGARLARGEIIAFQDSDDLWKPTKLERQITLLQLDRSISCCLCSVLMRVSDGNPFTSFDHSLVRFREDQGIWLNVLEVLTTRFILFNQAAAIRRDAWERVGGFREDLKYLEDYDLPLRLSLEGPWAYIKEPLVIYGERSPVSFSEQAKKDAILLMECETLIYKRTLALLEGKERYTKARRSLKRRLGLVRRQLIASQLQPFDRPVIRTVRNLVIKFERYRLAALRKLPSFPQPKTIPFEMLPKEHSPSERTKQESSI